MNFLRPSIFAALLLLPLSLPAADTPQPANAKLLAPTPPMGWNSWNWFGREVDEQIVRECIDAMAAQGLRDAGYQYVVVDGGWRDATLGPNGELVPHPQKFPHGIKPLADYAHSKGLKFGVHTCPGTHDCRGDAVGGYGHEELHVKQFVDWGLDFIKLDKCRFSAAGNKALVRGRKGRISGKGWDEGVLQATYQKWHDLLAQCGRDVVLSISAYQFRPWYPQVGQMGRTTGDLKARVSKGAVFDGVKLSVMDIAEINNAAAPFAGHGYWNDPDMLAIGQQGLSADEQKSHFALWCIMSAPLLLGNDPRNMTADEKDMILNRDCIAIDQDPTEQGKKIQAVGGAEIWAKRLAGNRVAVLLLNRSATATQPITLKASDVGLAGKFAAKDVYGKQDLGTFDSLTKPAPPHGCWFLLLRPE